MVPLRRMGIQREKVNEKSLMRKNEKKDTIGTGFKKTEDDD